MTLQVVAGAVMVQCFVASWTAVTVYDVGAPKRADVALGVIVTVAEPVPATADGAAGVAGVVGLAAWGYLLAESVGMTDF